MLFWDKANVKTIFYVSFIVYTQ